MELKPKNETSLAASLGTLIATNDGSLSLLHPEHGECYHSRMGALQEANLLYVEASGFQSRLLVETTPLCILDVGLGLGYNALATLNAWYKASSPPDLELASLEINPLLIQQLSSKQALWQQNWDPVWLGWCGSLQQQGTSRWQGAIEHPNGQSRCRWNIYGGDAVAVEFKPMLGTSWDYIWQDPFSPKKNPSMWGAEWFKRLYTQANSKSILVTYSVARAVKDALEASGWHYELLPTPGSKRSWLRAHPSI